MKYSKRDIIEYIIALVNEFAKRCVIISHTKSDRIKELLASALTDKIFRISPTRRIRIPYIILPLAAYQLNR